MHFAGPVVVGVEESNRSRDALALAQRLAAIVGDGLVLVNAYPYDEAAGGVPRPEYEAHVRAQSVALLEGLQRAHPAEIRCEPSLSPAHALHDVAEEVKAVAIVLGATHHAEDVLGTTAERLLAGAPAPLAIAPAGYAGTRPERLRRIAVAYAPGDAGRTAALHGAELAVRSGASLELVHVADPRVVAPDAWAGRGTEDELLTAQRSLARERLEAAGTDLPHGAFAGHRLVVGDSVEELRRLSAEVDLLVCGSRRYGPATVVLGGGVSTALMRRASCPVLVVPRTLAR